MPGTTNCSSQDTTALRLLMMSSKIAFVFTKLECDNSEMMPLGYGITYMYFIGLQEEIIVGNAYCQHKLVPMDSPLLCLPNQLIGRIQGSVIFQPASCFHQTIWYCLLSI